MVIVVRADASAVIGNGHIMRCLTLADELTAHGVSVHFVTRSLTAPTRAAIASRGHALHELPGADTLNDKTMPHATWLSAAWQDDSEATLAIAAQVQASWVVVDHYGIDAAWETRLRNAKAKIAVIDDLADRPHDCDLLLDQNLRHNPHDDYQELLPRGAQKLFGLRYVLLRPEFAAQPSKEFKHGDLNLCVAFSGADLQRLTLQTLEALEQVQQGPAAFDEIHIITNSQNADIDTIKAISLRSNWRISIDSDEVAGIMRKCDLAIGAGGGMLWERMACGLPSIAISVAENQRQQILNAESAGFVIGLQAEEANIYSIKTAITELALNVKLRRDMVRDCRKAIDGMGRTRVRERLLDHGIVLKLATSQDSREIWTWRNDARIRRYSGTTSEISWENHKSWFEAILQEEDRHLLIASDKQGALGVIRFDCDADSAVVSIYLIPDRLGQGRGASLLLAGEEWLKESVPNVTTVKAVVHKNNAPSVELFRSCGYEARAGHYQKQVRTTP